MADPPSKPDRQRDALPVGEAKAPAAQGPAAVVDPVAALLARRLVVRRERKGRGGKTVTVVQWPDGAEAAALDALAKELRKGLGTAAQREEASIAVQGDIADRVATWLAGRGAGRIVRGD
jgi:translation initiation factor 1